MAIHGKFLFGANVRNYVYKRYVNIRLKSSEHLVNIGWRIKKSQVIYMFFMLVTQMKTRKR